MNTTRLFPGRGRCPHLGSPDKGRGSTLNLITNMALTIIMDVLKQSWDNCVYMSISKITRGYTMHESNIIIVPGSAIVCSTILLVNFYSNLSPSLHACMGKPSANVSYCCLHGRGTVSKWTCQHRYHAFSTLEVRV